MTQSIRVAFFSDSYHEVNGVALTSRQFEGFARRRHLPFYCVRAGPREHLETDGSVTMYDLERSGAAFNLEATSELSFDPLIWRNKQMLMRSLETFRPDLIHITGPGDIGMFGAWIAHRLRVPLAASWHTNVHEYAGRRLEKLLSFLPRGPLGRMSAAAERHAFTGSMRFYRLAGLLFAPNQELVELLRQRTGRPCFLMQRGVDAEQFTPEKREPGARPFTIGYVGRLSVEKNIRFLAEVERTLEAAGKDYRFLIAGSGGDQEWLRANLKRADFLGVIKGEALARAYASMDVFAFPSHTDTFGNVILEALASGVPAVVTTGGGPKFLVRSGETGFVAADERAFIGSILDLMNDPVLHAEMCTAARKFACSISWDRVFESVYNAYFETLFSGGSIRAAS
jgi:glycosyltransferase involved in cell wall biosynthesis